MGTSYVSFCWIKTSGGVYYYCYSLVVTISSTKGWGELSDFLLPSVEMVMHEEDSLQGGDRGGGCGEALPPPKE